MGRTPPRPMMTAEAVTARFLADLLAMPSSFDDLQRILTLAQDFLRAASERDTASDLDARTRAIGRRIQRLPPDLFLSVTRLVDEYEKVASKRAARGETRASKRRREA